MRQYVDERPTPQAPLSLGVGSRSPTTGPESRYSAVLFIEKEGFNALLAQARIAERFDIAIMSTKGMSTMAARLLLDCLTPRIDKVLVAHDFDVAGFSIFGTLGSDGRRYSFQNDIRTIDLGLRLSDVEALGLDSEPVETSGGWSARAATLAAHGASAADINFLRYRHVELNAMPADVFVRFLERKLTEHGIGKVVPDNDVLEQHARHVLTRALTNKALDAIRAKAEEDATSIPCLPICTSKSSPLLGGSWTFHWIVPPRDLAPLLPLEPVMEPIVVRGHQPHCRRREVDWQQQCIGIRDRGQKPPARHRRLLRIPVNPGGPVKLPTLDRVVHHVPGHHCALAPRESILTQQ